MTVQHGRPRTAGLLTLADVFGVIAELLVDEMPVTALDVADALHVSRRSVGRLVQGATGLQWAAFMAAYVPVLRPQPAEAEDDQIMHRVTVFLSDVAWQALRRTAVAEFRDPRLEARRLLEQALVPACPLRLAGGACLRPLALSSTTVDFEGGAVPTERSAER
jgi:hypothetical protein